MAPFRAPIAQRYSKSAVLRIDAKFRLWLRNLGIQYSASIVSLIIDSRWIRHISPRGCFRISVSVYFVHNEHCGKKRKNRGERIPLPMIFACAYVRAIVHGANDRFSNTFLPDEDFGHLVRGQMSH